MAMLFPADKDALRLKIQKMRDDFHANFKDASAQNSANEPSQQNNSDLAQESLVQEHDLQVFQEAATQADKDSKASLYPFSQVEEGPPDQAPHTGSIEIRLLVPPAKPPAFSMVFFISGLIAGGALLALTHYLLIGL